MALPAFCEGVTTPAPCCDSVYMVAAEILNIAWNAFAVCADPASCEPVERFVAAAEPHLATQDYLAVYIADASLPFLATGRTKMINVTAARFTYNIKLMESGYPALEQALTEVYEPTAAELNWAAWHSLGHAEAVYRGVVSELVGDNVCGELAAINSLRPVGPTGGLIGWTFSVTLEAPWR